MMISPVMNSLVSTISPREAAGRQGARLFAVVVPVGSASRQRSHRDDIGHEAGEPYPKKLD